MAETNLLAQSSDLNIILDPKSFSGTNTLAYLSCSLGPSKKSFITLASGIRSPYDETAIEGTLINLSLLGAYVVCNHQSEEAVHGLKCIYSSILSINKKNRLYITFQVKVGTG